MGISRLHRSQGLAPTSLLQESQTLLNWENSQAWPSKAMPFLENKFLVPT